MFLGACSRCGRLHWGWLSLTDRWSVQFWLQTQIRAWNGTFATLWHLLNKLLTFLVIRSCEAKTIYGRRTEPALWDLKSLFGATRRWILWLKQENCPNRRFQLAGGPTSSWAGYQDAGFAQSAAFEARYENFTLLLAGAWGNWFGWWPGTICLSISCLCLRGIRNCHSQAARLLPTVACLHCSGEKYARQLLSILPLLVISLCC